MNRRSTRSTVSFSNPFKMAGYPDELLPGDYEVVVEEELLQGLSFEAYRKTAIYLLVHGRGRRAGRTELRLITQSDLDTALSHDRALTQNRKYSEAALFPQEDQ